MYGMIDWMLGYMSWPIFISAEIFPFFFKKNLQEKLVLLAMWVFPFIALGLFGRVLYPRYILFMIMPLLILSAYTISMILTKMKNHFVGYSIVGLLCLINIYSSYTIVFTIKSAYIPKAERGQYIDGWPSGWGIPEIVTILKDDMQNNKISVYTEGTFGLLPYALEIFLGDFRNIDIHGIWPIPREMPEDMRVSAKDHPTYFVMYQHQSPPFEWRLQLIQEYQKGLSTESASMRLYKVNP
jgi:hypothetical protein